MTVPHRLLVLAVFSIVAVTSCVLVHASTDLGAQSILDHSLADKPPKRQPTDSATLVDSLRWLKELKRRADDILIAKIESGQTAQEDENTLEVFSLI